MPKTDVKKELKIVKRNPASLEGYPENPRYISDEQFEALKAGLCEYGLVEPLLINSQNQVIGGNQRLRAIQELGWDTVPCVIQDFPIKKERALNIFLNKVVGEWNFELLGKALASFGNDNKDSENWLTGFSLEEIELYVNPDFDFGFFEEENKSNNADSGVIPGRRFVAEIAFLSKEDAHSFVCALSEGTHKWAENAQSTVILGENVKWKYQDVLLNA